MAIDAIADLAGDELSASAGKEAASTLKSQIQVVGLGVSGLVAASKENPAVALGGLALGALAVVYTAPALAAIATEFAVSLGIAAAGGSIATAATEIGASAVISKGIEGAVEDLASLFESKPAGPSGSSSSGSSGSGSSSSGDSGGSGTTPGSSPPSGTTSSTGSPPPLANSGADQFVSS